MKTGFILLLVCFCLCGNPFPALADNAPEGSVVSLHFSPYVVHYSRNSEHNSYPWFTVLEWESASRWEIGGAFFKNSYYQPCGYIYGGKKWVYGPQEQHLFLKLTAGAIIGYFEPYENKLPINDNGIGLGIIPTIGYKYRRATAQFVILGTAGFMVTLGYDIWK